MHETLCKKSKDDINNTGLHWEANMAAEDTNSKPTEEDHVKDREISISIENGNITMNDITAEERRGGDRDFITNIENNSITIDKTTEKQREQQTDPDIDQQRLENMKAGWNENYNKYKGKPLHEREFHTKRDRNIPENDLKIVDKLVTDFIEENLQKDGLSLNVICYTSAVTILDNLGRLKTKKDTYSYRQPGWQIQAETRVSSVRKKLSLIDVVQKCDTNDSYTKHQRNIQRKLKKWYGSSKTETLESKKVDLKQQLTSECEKLRRRKKTKECKRINYQFKVNPKQVYRKFKEESNIDITNAPVKDKIKEFWSNIWG